MVQLYNFLGCGLPFAISSCSYVSTYCAVALKTVGGPFKECWRRRSALRRVANGAPHAYITSFLRRKTMHTTKPPSNSSIYSSTCFIHNFGKKIWFNDATNMLQIPPLCRKRGKEFAMKKTKRAGINFDSLWTITMY